MTEDIIYNAMKLFDTPNKWQSFFELINIKETIQNKWWKKLQTEVYQRELNNLNKEWSIIIWNNWDIKWIIRGEDVRSLAVHFWGEHFRVYSNDGSLDVNKVNKLIEDPRFDLIKYSFERLDGSDFDTIGWETKNFCFGTDYDGRIPDSRTLSWYAGNRTSEFADQLIRKVRRFQTPEVTKLFKEINRTCKK